MSPEELKTIAFGKPEEWIKVKKFEDVGPEHDAYYKLREHHEKETAFLIKKCQELAAELHLHWYYSQQLR